MNLKSKKSSEFYPCIHGIPYTITKAPHYNNCYKLIFLTLTSIIFFCALSFLTFVHAQTTDSSALNTLLNATLNTTQETIQEPIQVPFVQDIELCQKAINAGYINYENYLLNPKDFQVLQLQSVIQPYLTRLEQALSTQDIQLVTVVLPPRALLFPELSTSTLENYRQLLQALEQTGLKTLAINSVFERTKADFFFYHDHHWTPYAASEIAKEIASFIAIDADKKQQFSSSPSQHTWLPYNSRLKNLSKLCGREYTSTEANYLYSWVTTMSASAGLFDTQIEGSAKPSVLLGTSNSESSTLNFAGFLSEHTGQNISNYAFSSSGALGSMFYYFLSEEYQQVKPRYIFWEFLANPHTTDFNLNAIQYYRQIIPSIYGSCDSEPIAAPITTQIATQITTQIATQRLELNNTTSKNYLALFAQATQLETISGSDFYLSFDLSGDFLDRIIVEIEYNSGHVDQSSLVLLASAKGRQKAYLELLDNSKQVQSIHLSFPEAFGVTGRTDVAVSLCRKN